MWQVGCTQRLLLQLRQMIWQVGCPQRLLLLRQMM
jgi:hypothetical protein